MVYFHKNNRKSNNKSQQGSKLPAGFTLIETIIVITIVIILSAIAVPSFKHLIISDRLQSVAWQMVQDLRETREDAILYQQDLNVYFNYDSSATPKPHSATDFTNREYFFETFQWGEDQNPQTVDVEHYIPTDTPCNHFHKRVLKYGIVISDIFPPSASSIDFDGTNYFVVTFRSGAGNTFRGEADIIKSMVIGASGEKRKVGSYQSIGSSSSPYVVITLEDVPSGQKFYVIIKSTGEVSMNGSPPS